MDDIVYSQHFVFSFVLFVMKLVFYELQEEFIYIIFIFGFPWWLRR